MKDKTVALKILLADDSMTAQNMGRKILTEAGYQVVPVSNGAAALKKLAEQRPDLLILDVFMPGYSGLEVCERVKKAQETSNTPVLLTVGKLEPFRAEDGNRVNADGLIVKPFEATDLLSAVKKLEEKLASTRFEKTVVIPPLEAARLRESASWLQSETEAEELPVERLKVPEEFAAAPALVDEFMREEQQAESESSLLGPDTAAEKELAASFDVVPARDAWALDEFTPLTAEDRVVDPDATVEFSLEPALERVAEKGGRWQPAGIKAAPAPAVHLDLGDTQKIEPPPIELGPDDAQKIEPLPCVLGPDDTQKIEPLAETEAVFESELAVAGEAEGAAETEAGLAPEFESFAPPRVDVRVVAEIVPELYGAKEIVPPEEFVPEAELVSEFSAATEVEAEPAEAALPEADELAKAVAELESETAGPAAEELTPPRVDIRVIADVAPDLEPVGMPAEAANSETPAAVEETPAETELALAEELERVMVSLKTEQAAAVSEAAPQVEPVEIQAEVMEEVAPEATVVEVEQPEPLAEEAPAKAGVATPPAASHDDFAKQLAAALAAYTADAQLAVEVPPAEPVAVSEEAVPEAKVETFSEAAPEPVISEVDEEQLAAAFLPEPATQEAPKAEAALLEEAIEAKVQAEETLAGFGEVTPEVLEAPAEPVAAQGVDPELAVALEAALNEQLRAEVPGEAVALAPTQEITGVMETAAFTEQANVADLVTRVLERLKPTLVAEIARELEAEMQKGKKR